MGYVFFRPCVSYSHFISIHMCGTLSHKEGELLGSDHFLQFSFWQTVGFLGVRSSLISENLCKGCQAAYYIPPNFILVICLSFGTSMGAGGYFSNGVSVVTRKAFLLFSAAPLTITSYGSSLKPWRGSPPMSAGISRPKPLIL